MNDRADSCGGQNNRATRNILPDMGGGLERDNFSGREQGESPVQHGSAGVAGIGNREIVANSESKGLSSNSPDRGENLRGSDAGNAAVDLARFPDGVRASVASMPGIYDARRLRSQREIIRDVMLSAADCETWLTLGELRALTRYGEASISAQLRHLRKEENGGYEVIKRHREGASPERPGTDGRGDCVWEYRMTRDTHGDRAEAEVRLEAVGA